MKRVALYIIIGLILFTGCSNSQNTSDSTESYDFPEAVKVQDDKKSLNDYVTEDELSKYVFTWQQDLGMNQKEVQDSFQNYGFNYTFDRLGSIDPQMWYVTFMKTIGQDDRISGKDQFLQDLMEPQIWEILKPDAEEMSTIENYTNQQLNEFYSRLAEVYSKYYEDKEKAETSVQLLDMSCDQAIKMLQDAKQKYQSLGFPSSDIQAVTKQLDNTILWKKFFEDWDKSKALVNIDAGLWSVKSLYIASVLAYTHNSRATELRQFINSGLTVVNFI